MLSLIAFQVINLTFLTNPHLLKSTMTYDGRKKKSFREFSKCPCMIKGAEINGLTIWLLQMTQEALVPAQVQRCTQHNPLNIKRIFVREPILSVIRALL
jgi:hypothetical protein